MLLTTLPVDWDAESDLIRRAKEHDRGAWEVLYQRYQSAIYRYAFARLRHPQDAEDILSQTYLRALQGIQGYSQRGTPFVGWLYRIAQNLIRDQMRRKGRRPEAPLEDINQIPSDVGLDLQMSRMELLEAIERLGDQQRDVVLLRFFSGLPARDVAAALGKSESAVWSLQVRAIESLRRFLS
jgi:RNA polymerase sigma-70 factor (ECF subfamily)